MKYILSFIVVTIMLFSCQNEPAVEKTVPKSAKKKQVKQTKPTLSSGAKNVTVKSGENATPARANRTIDYKNVDLKLMEALLHAEINKVRKANGLSILGKNPILRNAAVDQNNYQLTQENLTHKQRTPGKENLIDRVRHYGGGFQLMAENLIYEGFTVRTINGVKSEIIAPTYQEMAKTLTKNWLASPPHKKNILQSELKLVGTAIAFNAKNYAIYGTQVFGTKL